MGREPRTVRNERPRLDPIDAEPSGERPIALLAGSFDPPTVAHVGLARSWTGETGGDVVLVYAVRTLPKEAGTEAPLLDDAGRIEALRRMAAAYPWLYAARASHGLLLDQATAAHDRWPDTPLTLLLGSDKVRQLFDPVWYGDRDEALERLFAVAEVRYADREGDAATVAAILEDPANGRFRDRVARIEVPLGVSAISSREVRRRVRSGDPVAGLVPPEVLPMLAI